jgi:hypothetical protein
MGRSTMDERPRFARNFPEDPALDALVEAFARGDYARIRAECPGLSRSAADASVRRACRVLLARTRPDPLAVFLVALTAALLVVIAAYWTTRGGADPRAAPRPPSVVEPPR